LRKERVSIVSKTADGENELVLDTNDGGETACLINKGKDAEWSGQRLCYSVDAGQTWNSYAEPVIANQGYTGPSPVLLQQRSRDPEVFYDQVSGRHMMVVLDEEAHHVNSSCDSWSTIRPSTFSPKTADTPREEPTATLSRNSISAPERCWTR